MTASATPTGTDRRVASPSAPKRGTAGRYAGGRRRYSALIAAAVATGIEELGRQVSEATREAHAIADEVRRHRLDERRRRQ